MFLIRFVRTEYGRVYNPFVHVWKQIETLSELYFRAKQYFQQKTGVSREDSLIFQRNRFLSKLKKYQRESNILNLSGNMSHEFASILNPVILNKQIEEWLIEDQPAFDLQSLAVTGAIKCSIYCKQKCVLAGLTFLDAISSKTDMIIDFQAKDGDSIDVSSGKKVVATVTGNAPTVLKHERLILNILSRCSGVATLTRRIRGKLEENGWNGLLSGTRKTTPGFRVAEKFSLLVGYLS